MTDTYNKNLDADTQISVEEEIASMIFDYDNHGENYAAVTEEDAHMLSKDILKRVL